MVGIKKLIWYSHLQHIPTCNIHLLSPIRFHRLLFPHRHLPCEAVAAPNEGATARTVDTSVDTHDRVEQELLLFLFLEHGSAALHHGEAHP